MKKFLQLCALLGCIAPWSHASLIFQGVVNFKGGGLGSALTSLTFQDNGAEAGCVAFIGGVDVIGSCDGASVIAQTSVTGPVTDYSNLAVVFAPAGGPVTLDSAVVTIAANGHTFSAAGVTDCPKNNCTLTPTTDGSAYVAHLDSAQAAQALATLGPLAPGTSASVSVATVASGHSNSSLGVYVNNTTSSGGLTGTIVVGDAAVPEPGTFALASGALLLLIPLFGGRQRRA